MLLFKKILIILVTVIIKLINYTLFLNILIKESIILTCGKIELSSKWDDSLEETLTKEICVAIRAKHAR